MPVLITSHSLPTTAISTSQSSSDRIILPPRRRSNLHLHHRPHPRFHFSNPSRSGRFVVRSSSMPLHVSSSSPRQLKDDLLAYSRGFWVTRSLIAWNPAGEEEASSGYSCFLYASNAASLTLSEEDGVSGYDVQIELQECNAGLPESVVEKFCHLRGYRAFEVPSTANAKSLLKCQLMVAAFGPDGKFKDATGLQLPGILDDLFAYDGPLGAHYSEDAVSLYLWAPTAQAVRAFIYKDPHSRDPFEIVPLQEHERVWRTVGPRDWEGCYYAYEIYVYHPSTLAVEKCYASDPYARGLSSDCQRTLLVNLQEDSLKPAGWDKLADEKPSLHSFTDISIYELHIRDFSANDQTVDPSYQGGYLAFTLEGSAGMLHLKELSKAGITHVHLLPTFQFAGVDDVKENWKSVGKFLHPLHSVPFMNSDKIVHSILPRGMHEKLPHLPFLDYVCNTKTGADSKLLESFPPDSLKQQALITEIQDYDGYNWGYNPVLWGVPKGSFASNPDGPCRIIEFRKMVQQLNKIGLRVVMDVVYNHLHGSGPHDENSVLDKIVPGYYLRRNIDGVIENSTCVNNTASEHYMVERLIIDDLLNWAANYKVDGFRFDLMGHLMKKTVVKARDALRSLKIENGVDGSKIYLYGEGWDFGEVAQNGRGINASQFNLPGTGIGSFNDRIRDAMLGGSPFGDPLQQGFVTGLMLQPNGHDHGGKDVEAVMLASAKDHIQIGMAANLRDFVLTDSEGKAVKGSELLCYGGASVAYASQPSETINYVSAHDNETLFDIVSMKTPMGMSVDERCRLNHLATSIIALSQGIPFFHAGDEMLRSKSLDRDSYNSGDWFNRLDFSYKSNNWGVGLPPEEKNQKNWPLIKPRLADPSFKPQKEHILAAVQNFLNIMRIRYSSPLFCLTTANAIQERVRFHNTGPSWVPGVIVMSIEDGNEGLPGLSQLDPIYSYVVVIFNCAPTKVSFTSPAIRGRSLQLHPVQLMSADRVVKNSSYKASTGCFVVPQLTTSVFVEHR